MTWEESLWGAKIGRKQCITSSRLSLLLDTCLRIWCEYVPYRIEINDPPSAAVCCRLLIPAHLLASKNM
ncbi:unnamed protein product [Penicillium roqueforti FM164]|uniref:Genomic scaffold, ProqFM164S01 n=1 Tax=Penicillium roqueforti (strain FM164) TaxID=1365484 RepID=W6PZ21_PENRF|nr:unnamed protein product [Penicillium roqueforti FM164]